MLNIRMDSGPLLFKFLLAVIMALSWLRGGGCSMERLHTLRTFCPINHNEKHPQNDVFLIEIWHLTDALVYESIFQTKNFSLLYGWSQTCY